MKNGSGYENYPEHNFGQEPAKSEMSPWVFLTALAIIGATIVACVYIIAG